MKWTLRLTALALLATPGLAQAQELFVLARFNRIIRIDGFATATPTPVVVTTYGNLYTPMGLEIDRTTGDFLVLTTDNLNTLDSKLLRVDPNTGQTTTMCDFPGLALDGFDQRSDGELFAISRAAELVRIDVSTCTWSTTPLSQQIGSAPFQMLGLTVDERGDLLVETARGERFVIDPLDGTVTSVPSAVHITLGVERDEDGTLYLTDIAGALYTEDATTGQVTQVLPQWGFINNGYSLAFTKPVDGAGIQEVCAGLPNSTGFGSTLEVLGTSTASANDLELYSRHLPTNEFGYFLMGPNAGSQPVGQGVLCIAPPVFRYSSSVLNTGLTGTVRFPIDLPNLPNGTAAMAGDVYVFQLWHRDGTTSNLSTALEVTFQ